jgi:hypothetical protein
MIREKKFSAFVPSQQRYRHSAASTFMIVALVLLTPSSAYMGYQFQEYFNT